MTQTSTWTQTGPIQCPKLGYVHQLPQYIPSSALYVSSRSTSKPTTSSPSWICLALLRTLFAFSSLRLCFAMISAWVCSLFLSDADSFSSNYKNSPIKYTWIMNILKACDWDKAFLRTRTSLSYWSRLPQEKRARGQESVSILSDYPAVSISRIQTQSDQVWIIHWNLLHVWRRLLEDYPIFTSILAERGEGLSCGSFLGVNKRKPVYSRPLP